MEEFELGYRHVKCGPARPIDRVTLKAAEKYSVWVWALDEEANPGRDETWVYPVDLKAIPKRSDIFLVRAVVTLANGESCPALMQLEFPDQTDWCNPVMLFWGGKSYDFSGSVNSAKALSRGTRRPLEKLYPIQWQLMVRVKGERSFRRGVERLQTVADIEANRRFFALLREQIREERKAKKT